jgi:hypothetical protein
VGPLVRPFHWVHSLGQLGPLIGSLVGPTSRLLLVGPLVGLLVGPLVGPLVTGPLVGELVGAWLVTMSGAGMERTPLFKMR